MALGETSPLYQELVLEKQIVDFVGADYSPHTDPYLFLVLARLKKVQDLQKVEDAINAALEQAKNNPVDSKRLSDVKSNLKYRFLMSFDTSKSIVNGIYSSQPPYIAMVRGVGAVDRLFQTYESVTAEEIQKTAQKYFQKEKRTAITVTGAK